MPKNLSKATFLANIELMLKSDKLNSPQRKAADKFASSVFDSYDTESDVKTNKDSTEAKGDGFWNSNELDRANANNAISSILNYVKASQEEGLNSANAMFNGESVQDLTNPNATDKVSLQNDNQITEAQIKDAYSEVAEKVEVDFENNKVTFTIEGKQYSCSVEDAINKMIEPDIETFDNLDETTKQTALSYVSKLIENDGGTFIGFDENTHLIQYRTKGGETETLNPFTTGYFNENTLSQFKAFNDINTFVGQDIEQLKASGCKNFAFSNGVLSYIDSNNSVKTIDYKQLADMGLDTKVLANVDLSKMQQ